MLQVFLVEENNVDELANCLAKVKNMTVPEVMSMRNNARSVCVERYNNSKLNTDILKLTPSLTQ